MAAKLRQLVGGGLVAGLVIGPGLGLGLGPAPSAAAAPTSCRQAPSPGAPIPALAPRDPLISELGLDQAWTLATGRGVTVGVVDTGVDPASPKLRGAVQPGQSFHVVSTKAVYARTPDGRVDCDGHGTEVAAIIAGRTDAGDDRVSGIAPDAMIYPAAIVGDVAQAPAAMLGAAIVDAARHSSVLNLSFAQTTDSPEIRSAVEYAVRVRHVVVVASVANDAGTGVAGQNAKSYPAAYPGVLAVTAVSSNGTVDSNAPRGPWVSIAAPGGSLMTVTRGGKGYVSVTGTSFATAIVTGTAALLRQRFPTMSPDQIIARLEQTAVPPGDGRHDPAMGYGIVDPYAALTAAMVPSGQPSAPTRAAVPVQKVHRAARHGNSATVLAVTTLLVALAVLVGLATLSVRVGRRRGWYPGAEPRTELDARTAEPHPAELS